MALHRKQYTAATGDVAGSPFDAVTATSRARYTELAALLTFRNPTAGFGGTDDTERGYVVLEAIQKAIAEITQPSIKVSISELRTALNTGLDA